LPVVSDVFKHRGIKDVRQNREKLTPFVRKMSALAQPSSPVVRADTP